MDLTDITERTGALAAQFAVRAPRVELGTVPRWCVDGVHVELRNTETVLTVGPAYGALSFGDQQCALAEAVAGTANLQATGFLPLLGAFAVVAVTAMAASALPGLAPWQVGTLTAASLALTLPSALIVWSRANIYRVDRRMTEVLGPEMVAAALDLDERSRRGAHGFAGVLLRLSMPGRARRARRLADTPPPA